MSMTVRPIHEDELAAWLAALSIPFFIVDRDPVADASLRRQYIEISRCLAAFDDARICGTFRSLSTELTVPGGAQVAASAITGVTVLPTHRRRGLLTSMMTRDLADSVDRGEPLAVLIASEYPIYGRYGFGHATDQVRISVDARAARFREPGEGTVELVSATELREEGPALYDRERAVRPGFIARRPFWWDGILGLIEVTYERVKGPRYVLHRDDAGDPQGYLRYHIEEHWNDRRSDSEVVVDEIVACTPGAYARLWRYACEVDLAPSVKADLQPPEEPLPFLLTDGRAVRQQQRTDFLWVRVLDPVAALAARRYLVPGRTILEVADPLGHAAGRFVLEGGPDGATCRRTQEPADLALDAEALGAAYLGGTAFRMLAGAGRVTELRPGALDVADPMFRSPVVPFCSTWF